MSETSRYTLLHASFEETLSLVEREGGCDLVCMSPPYDDARTYGADVAWTAATYRRLGDYVFAALKPGGHALVVLDGPVREWRQHVGSERSFTPWRVMLDWAERVGFRVPEHLAYAHMGTPGSWLGRFRSDWEPLLWFQRPGAPGYFNKWPLATRVTTSHGGRGRLITTRRRDGTMYRRRMSGRAVDLGLKHRGTLWDYGTVGHGHDDALGESSNHPARFSTKLAEDIVLCFSPPTGLVCDPFLGSGTTAVAALRHGRRFFGGDLHSNEDGTPWVEVAQRWIEESARPPCPRARRTRHPGARRPPRSPASENGSLPQAPRTEESDAPREDR